MEQQEELVGETSESTFRIGDRFTSFASLRQKLKAYEEATRTEYWVRDTRTLQVASKNVPQRVKKSNINLKYYYVKFSCIHGGQKFRERPRLTNRRKKSFRQGCLAYIYCSLSDDCQFLVVKSMVNEHNHPLGFKKSLNCNRPKLVSHHKPRVDEMAAVKEKSDINLGKIVLKDLSNVARVESHNPMIENDVQLSVMILEGRGCQVEALMGENNEFNGLFFQDQTMRDGYALFPETLFVDGTYKIPEIGTSVYLFVIIDSIGNTEIVATAILYNKDDESFDWVVGTFKDKNPKWPRTRVVMAGTDNTGRVLLRRHFKHARVLICQYHAMQVFKKEVTSNALNITPTEEVLAKQCIQNIMHSKSLTAYTELYVQMAVTLPTQVLIYYNKNWHSIREDWVFGFSNETGDFLNSTCNRVASLNRRLTAKICKYRSLKQFVEELFGELEKQRNERGIFVTNMLGKKPTQEFDFDSCLLKYVDLLTDFAFQYFHKQYLLINEVDKTLIITEGGTIVGNSSVGEVAVTSESCECPVFKSIGLPCRHLLLVRRDLQMDLFDASLCLDRWTKRFYTGRLRRVQQTMSIKIELEDISTPVVPEVKGVATKSLTLSSVDKHSVLLAQRITTLLSQVCNYCSKGRIKLIEQIVKHWENMEEVDLKTVRNVPDDQFCSNGQPVRKGCTCRKTASSSLLVCPPLRSAQRETSVTSSNTSAGGNGVRKRYNAFSSSRQTPSGFAKRKKVSVQKGKPVYLVNLPQDEHATLVVPS